MAPVGDYARESMAKGTDAGRSTEEKGGRRMEPVPASRRTASRLGLWKDAQDIVMMQLDALLVVLIAALVLIPILWVFAGDLALLAGYTAALALMSFILFFAALYYIDRRVRTLDAYVAEAGGRQRAGKKR